MASPCKIRCMTLLRMTDSMIGAGSGWTARRIPNRLNMYRRMLSALLIWMNTEPGAMFRVTGRCGRQHRLLSAGHLITTDIGCGLSRGAGPGLTMLPGDSLHPTMAAGFTPAVIGAGLLDRWWSPLVPSMRQRSSLL